MTLLSAKRRIEEHRKYSGLILKLAKQNKYTSKEKFFICMTNSRRKICIKEGL